MPGASTPGRDDDRVDPAEAYVDLVQKDHVICDTCFAYRYDAMTVEWWRGSFGWSEYQTWTARREHAVPVPADETPAQGMRLACAHCGTRGGVKHRPVPAEKLDTYVANLSDTLALKGITHAPRRLHAEARARNTSENQGRQDTHVFAPAVERAIRAARHAEVTRGDAPGPGDRAAEDDTERREQGAQA